MSAAFTPPDSMSPDDIRTVADVRRSVWINGTFGFISGAAAGAMGHLVLQTLQKKYVGGTGTPATASLIYNCLRPLPPLGKNTLMLSVMGGASLGSFVLSSTAGKNAVHLLHPIFQLGRQEHGGKSPYQIAVTNAQQPEEMTDSITMNSANNVEDELDAAHDRARSLRRRASLKQRFESGHSLSDTDGNTWPFTDAEETGEMQKDRAMHRAQAWARRQTERRQIVQDRIERGAALSDSTGGQWSLANDSRK